MAWNDRYSWLLKEKACASLYMREAELEVGRLKRRINQLECERYMWCEKELKKTTIDDSERKEYEEKINSLKDRIVNLKVENAYLRGFLDGDPKNSVTIEKNFFS